MSALAFVKINKMKPPLTHPFTLPSDYTRIKVVHSFAELVTTPFRDGINALCWQRSLPGDFSEVAAALLTDEDITSIEPQPDGQNCH
jgi:hypothetical protein